MTAWNLSLYYKTLWESSSCDCKVISPFFFAIRVVTQASCLQRNPFQRVFAFLSPNHYIQYVWPRIHMCAVFLHSCGLSQPNPDSTTLSHPTVSDSDAQGILYCSIQWAEHHTATVADWRHSSQWLWFHQTHHSLFQKCPRGGSLLHSAKNMRLVYFWQKHRADRAWHKVRHRLRIEHPVRSHINYKRI